MVGGENLRQLAHRHPHRQPRQHRQEHPQGVAHPAVGVEDDQGDDQNSDRGQPGGHVVAPMQGGSQLAVAHPHKKRSDYGGEHTDGRHRQGVDDRLNGEGAASEHEGRKDDGSHQRPHVGFEQVGPHSGHIPHVVPHVVGDHRRVAGVVLRYPRLHFAHQIGPHVRRLGVDASPHPGEQGDGGSAQPDGGDHVVEPIIEIQQFSKDQVAQGHAQQPQAGHRESHHRPAPKGHRQSPAHPSGPGRLGGTGVGGGGDAHPCEPGPGRQNRSENVGDGTPRPPPGQKDKDEDGQGGHEHRHPGVFAAHKGVGPFANGRRNFPHALVAGVGGQHRPGVHRGQNQGRRPRQEGDCQYRVFGHRWGFSLFGTIGLYAGCGPGVRSACSATPAPPPPPSARRPRPWNGPSPRRRSRSPILPLSRPPPPTRTNRAVPPSPPAPPGPRL